MLVEVGACVRSGFCCKQSPCAFGAWDNIKKQCIHLSFSDNLACCDIYSEIIKDPTSIVSPAFGQGCCATLFNEERKSIIISQYGGVIPTVTVEF